MVKFKRYIYLFIIALFTFALSSCFVPDDLVFKSETYQIKLNESFEETAIDDINNQYDKVLMSRKYSVSIQINSQMNHYTLDEFTDYVISMMKTKNITISKTDGVSHKEERFKYLTYENISGDGTLYAYGTSIFKHPNGSFYIIDMAVSKINVTEELSKTFIEWAKTFEFINVDTSTSYRRR